MKDEENQLMDAKLKVKLIFKILELKVKRKVILNSGRREKGRELGKSGDHGRRREGKPRAARSTELRTVLTTSIRQSIGKYDVCVKRVWLVTRCDEWTDRN